MQQRNPFFAFFETFIKNLSWEITILTDCWLYDRQCNHPFAQGSAAKRRI